MNEPFDEGSIEMRRVTFEVPATDLPDLMAVLGEFAVGHNLAIVFSDASEPTEPTEPTEERPRYDPKLVTWMYDEQTEEDVAVVSWGHLKAFAIDQDGNSNRGERLANCLFRSGNLERGTLSFLVMSGESTLGLRADRLKELAEAVERGAIRLTNLGPKSKDLLQAYSKALFAEDDQTA